MVILISLIEGCPLVLRIRAHHLDQPIAARELSRWRDRLEAAGLEMTEAELRERTLEVSEASQAFHATLLSPIRPLFDVFQISQRWSLFPVADPRPWWMHIDVRTERNADGRDERATEHADPDAHFELVYRPADSRFDSPRLAYRRIRAHWNPGTGGPRYRYPEFVRWALGEFDAEEIRVRFLRHTVRDPHATEQAEMDVNISRDEWLFEMRHQTVAD